MPSDVAFTTVVAPERYLFTENQSITLTLAPKSDAIFSARARVRFVIQSSGAPFSRRDETTARAAPPAPKTSAGPSEAFHVGWC